MTLKIGLHMHIFRERETDRHPEKINDKANGVKCY